MLNECLDLLNTKIEVKVEDKTLTENLRSWRKDRNITNANYLVFVGNVLEELFEPIYEKVAVCDIKTMIINQYFSFTDEFEWSQTDIIDAIKDIKVFCINETEIMGYCDKKTDNEVFKHINCRKQDLTQYLEWKENGVYGKWKKWSEQPQDEIYQPDYESCKL